MGRKLNSYVHVHRNDYETVIYGPDDDVPAADAKLITNPDAWADGKGGDTPPEAEPKATRK